MPPNAAGPLISLALRLQDFNLSVKLNADCLWQVAEHFEVARNIRAIPMSMGVSLHPDVVQAMHAKSKWPLIRTLNKVLYRTDTLSQFPEMEHLDHNSKKKQEKQQRDAARLLALPQSEAVTYDVLRAKALHAHFLAVADAKPDMMFCAAATLLEGPLKGMQSALTMVAVQSTEPLESDSVQSGPPPQLAALQALPMMAQDPQPQRETGVMPAEQQPAFADDLRFFNVVHSSPSRRKTLALPAGASLRRLAEFAEACMLPKASSHSRRGGLWKAPTSGGTRSVSQECTVHPAQSCREHKFLAVEAAPKQTARGRGATRGRAPALQIYLGKSAAILRVVGPRLHAFQKNFIMRGSYLSPCLGESSECAGLAQLCRFANLLHPGHASVQRLASSSQGPAPLILNLRPVSKARPVALTKRHPSKAPPVHAPPAEPEPEQRFDEWAAKRTVERPTTSMGLTTRWQAGAFRAADGGNQRPVLSKHSLASLLHGQVSGAKGRSSLEGDRQPSRSLTRP